MKYPTTKPNKAFVKIGDNVVVNLPPTKWKCGKYTCSYHIDQRTPLSAMVRLTSTIHTSVAVEISLSVGHFGMKETTRKHPDAALAINWSTGGIDPKVTAIMVSEIQADLFIMADVILCLLRDGAEKWANE